MRPSLVLALVFGMGVPALAQSPEPRFDGSQPSTGTGGGAVRGGRHVQPTQGSLAGTEADPGAEARSESERKLDAAQARGRAATRSICRGC